MSSSIIKLIDSSLIPAALVILGKVIGLYITISILDLDWQMNFENNKIIGVYPVVFEHDLQRASTYSDLIMLLIVYGGLGFETFRSIFLHNTHIHPSVVVRLVNLNLFGLVKDSFYIYFKASMWFVFSLLALCFVILNFFQGKTSFWVPLFGLIILVLLTVFLIRDVEMEVKNRMKDLSL